MSRRRSARSLIGNSPSDEDQAEIARISSLESAARAIFKQGRKVLSDKIKSFISTLGEEALKAYEEQKSQAARLELNHNVEYCMFIHYTELLHAVKKKQHVNWFIIS